MCIIALGISSTLRWYTVNNPVWHIANYMMGINNTNITYLLLRQLTSYVLLYTFLQPVQMAKFVWLVVLFLMRDEWKSVRTKHGALFVMTTGKT